MEQLEDIRLYDESKNDNRPAIAKNKAMAMINEERKKLVSNVQHLYKEPEDVMKTVENHFELKGYKGVNHALDNSIDSPAILAKVEKTRISWSKIKNKELLDRK